jgi:hypothetical protein
MALDPSEKKAKRKSRNREQGVPIRCYHCGHVWKYRGRMLYATCPRCNRKVNIKMGRISEEEYRLLTGEL